MYIVVKLMHDVSYHIFVSYHILSKLVVHNLCPQRSLTEHFSEVLESKYYVSSALGQGDYIYMARASLD